MKECYFCKGATEIKNIDVDFRWEGKLYVIKNVPVEVCNQCGEKFLMPEVAKEIDRILEEKGKPSKTIQVSVYHYEHHV